MKSLCSLILLIGLTFSAIASDTLDLSAVNTNGLSVTNNYLEFFEDTNSKCDFLEVYNKKHFGKLDFDYNVNPNSTYWLKFCIKNPNEPFLSFVLENYYSFTPIFELYYFEKGKIYCQKTGNSFQYSKRNYNHKNLVLDLPQTLPNDVRTYFY